jgi:hypothetical protein
VNVAAAYAGDVIHFGDVDAGIAKTQNQSFVIAAAESRMRLFRGAKVALDTHVNLNRSALKSASAALGKRLRFLQLDHPQDISVETSSRLFSIRGHGELDVIDGGEWSVCHHSWNLPSLLHWPSALRVGDNLTPAAPVRIKY